MEIELQLRRMKSNNALVGTNFLPFEKTDPVSEEGSTGFFFLLLLEFENWFFSTFRNHFFQISGTLFLFFRTKKTHLQM